ncbi:hypothetical protein [Leptolyngbya iicbica]|uniref:Uncharacterized protein n=2 Tax=Cyanophyceae TaxID=3028117 RepID=A0A4Q7EA65_9CYAN|nr:hypothetical protein [Leptolyngbya sp. LK]RZM79787.1 hypothetical protein DYY88_13950 [Leptolyngbya sp. LK]
MFETLIVSSLCFYINPPGQTIGLSDRCIGATATLQSPQYSLRESAFLTEYRRLYPNSIFTDAEALLSGQVSCGEGADSLSTQAASEFIMDTDATELVAMLMQHWEASHRAALSQLCPHLRIVTDSP